MLPHQGTGGCVYRKEDAISAKRASRNETVDSSEVGNRLAPWTNSLVDSRKSPFTCNRQVKMMVLTVNNTKNKGPQMAKPDSGIATNRATATSIATSTEVSMRLSIFLQRIEFTGEPAPAAESAADKTTHAAIVSP